MRNRILHLTAFLFFTTYLVAQNSMTGDGFGGRGWYVPHNYQVGAYSAYTVCGDSNQLYGWGGNLWGELGNGTNNSSIRPIAALGMKNIKFYSTGYASAAIKNDHTAWVWGNCSYRNSGLTNTPSQKLTEVKFVDAGTSHIVFVRQDGTVWGIGQNQNGELGNGSSSVSPIPVPVNMANVENAVRAIAVGYNAVFGNEYYLVAAATIILLEDSTVQIIGGNNWFQQNNTPYSPTLIAGLKNIIDIKGNAIAVYALSSTGEVYSFGRNLLDFYNVDRVPALGIGPTNGNFIPPTKITFPIGAGSIVALSSNNDGYSCLALDTNHNVYAWGYNIHGQLGDGTVVEKNRPTLVATDAIDIFAGENFSYILKADNTLWATGASGYLNDGNYWGSIWMNRPNVARTIFTQVDPTITPMNLCAPKVWGVLPIKLSNFTCVANGNSAVLNWQSSEEINAGKYIVEFSKDGIHFQNIATILAKGVSSNYSYTHQQVSATAFYRLKMIDKDGSFTYSAIRVIRLHGKTGITIAPNPTSNTLSVFPNDNANIQAIQLFSLDGKLMKIIERYQSGQQIALTNFSSGTYILKAVYRDGSSDHGKFINIDSCPC